MTRILVLGALIPVLMTSTALAQDQMVAAEADSFTLTGTVGGAGFWLPEYDAGLFGDPNGDPLVGVMLGLSGNTTIGTHDNWDVIFGFNVFGAIAGDAGTSSTETFSGPGTVYVTGLSTPDGSSDIDLDTAADTATSVVVSPGGSSNTVTASGAGNTSAATFAPGVDGFLIGGGSVDATGEMAFGAIGDVSGGIFVATGDLTGLEITTDTSRDIFYSGADLTLGLGTADNGGTLFSVYTGPSYRGLYQNISTDLTVDPEEATGGTGVTLPNFTISSDENLNTHYLGGILGGSAAFAVGDGVIFSLGVEGGVYGVHSSWNGTDTYSSEGGLFDDPNDDPDAGSVAQVPISITADELSEDDVTDDAIAFAARGNAAVTWAIGERQAFSLGGSLEYLSQVATVTHDRVFVSDSAGTADFPGPDVPTGDPSFSWGSMVNFSITASLTGTF